MKIFYYRKELEDYLKVKKSSGKVIGLVPTMGALHEGHISLIKEAQSQCDLVVCSIFVNPTQFNNAEDLRNYPRMPEEDCNLLEENGCHIAFVPSVEEVYTDEIMDPVVDLGELANVFEGAYRPGHFDGVLNVVHRLFSIVKPQKAFFGAKDFQQCLVVQALTEQVPHDTEIVKCPIIREEDGLAMSSRNLRLDEEARATAPMLNFALRSIAGSRGRINVLEALKLAKKHLNNHGFEIDYLAVADAANLKEIGHWNDAEQYVAVSAAEIGGIRLIDNVTF